MTSNEHDFDITEFYIAKCLLTSDLYCRSYITKMTPDLFSPKTEDIIKGIKVFFNKYNRIPSARIMEDKVLPMLCKKSSTRLSRACSVLNDVNALDIDVANQYDWICDETKKFIKTKRIINAVVKVVDLVEEHKHEEIVEIMENAFQINFDESLGVEYFENLEDRLAHANSKDEIIPTGYPSLDSRIGGGYRRKSMFVFAGPANVGKTLVLNDAASSLAFLGFNVLYLSLELSENYIQQRTDAKFANVPMSEVDLDPEMTIKKAIERRNKIREDGKPLGKIIYKEFAPNTVCSNDIRALMKNLEIHAGFKPDFIIIDYLKLVRPNGKSFSDNTYGKVVTVCEELRGLAFEYNTCVLSASQTGRQSYGQGDVNMEDVSDSIGISQTVDVLVTLARPNDLDEEDTMRVKIAKSRFSRNNSSFLVKVNYKYMKIIDEQADEPLHENTNTKRPLIPKDIEDIDEEIYEEENNDKERPNLEY